MTVRIKLLELYIKGLTTSGSQLPDAGRQRCSLLCTQIGESLHVVTDASPVRIAGVDDTVVVVVLSNA